MQNALKAKIPKAMSRHFLLPSVCCFLLSFFCPAQEVPSSAQETQPAEESEDWAPQLLDAVLSSPNPEARDALYRAAFASGATLLPQLQAALKDDRTAEFAAQSLAFIGGDKALEVLASLESDRRDLNLRRFF